MGEAKKAKSKKTETKKGSEETPSGKPPPFVRDEGTDGPAALGGNRLVSRSVTVPMHADEIRRLSSRERVGHMQAPADLIRWAVASVVGERTQPWRFVSRSPGRSGRINRVLREHGDGVMRVQVKLTERALRALADVGGSTFGAESPEQLVRWALLRRVLHEHPARVREALDGPVA